MVHLMRQRQSTSGTTQTNRAHHRRQRTPSDTSDCLMLKDVAGTGGLTALSMYVRTFGYGMSQSWKRKAQQTCSQQCGQ